MAVDIEFGNIKPDCTGNPTSVGPRWRRWDGNVLLSFFSRPRVPQRIHKNKRLTFELRWTGCTGHFCYAEWPWTSPKQRNAVCESYEITGRHFWPQVNISFERHQFRQAKQEESETADQFVTRLFQLSENCDFGTSKQEQIRDQLIDKCRSHELRKKLLVFSD